MWGGGGGAGGGAGGELGSDSKSDLYSSHLSVVSKGRGSGGHPYGS